MALKTFDGSISFHEVRFSTVCWVMNWHIPSNTSKKHMRNWGIDSPSAVSTSSHFNHQMFSAVSTSSHFNHPTSSHFNHQMFSAVSTSSHFNHQMFSAVSTSSYFNHQMFSAVSTSSHFNHHDNQLHPYPQGPQFPQKNFTNSAANSAVHHGNTDEIPCITAATQVKFRGLIKSWLDKSNTWTMNLWILHYLLINYHFHQSTKPKINVNKLITEQL